ncbi:MAG: UDP-N-acetylmuramate--L-alanine ligase [Bacillota bacterium]
MAELQDIISGPLHFVGAGGYGMSGLARVFAATGSEVTGCDLRESARVHWLRSEGVPVTIGHSRDHLRGVRALVHTTDVPPDNPEILAAEAAGLPVLHRSHLLAHLFRTFSQSIAVSGTHGKTSTTAMMASVLEVAGLDPTALVGGEAWEPGVTARVGDSEYLVAEACESDGTFRRYHPAHIIATNLEPEHLEYYCGRFDCLASAFADFLGNVRPGGVVAVNADDRRLVQMADRTPGRPVLCSASGDSPAEYRALDMVLKPDRSEFTLARRGEKLARLTVAVPGGHMVANALRVAAAAREIGCPLSAIETGLASYGGVKRRFQRIGLVRGVAIVDDYAHHPTEIRATLKTARQLAENRVIAVFQPQRHTRTHHLMDEFSRCFDGADRLILTPIYSPPGQNPIPGVSSESLAERIRGRTDLPVRVMREPAEIARYLDEIMCPGDVVLTMGAGDVWKIAAQLVGGRTPSASTGGLCQPGT